MNPTEHSYDTLVEQAGIWLGRLDSDSDRDQQGGWDHPEFLDWMARSERHRLAFAEASALWFDSAQVQPASASNPPAEHHVTPRRRPVGRWQAVGFALLLIAAALIPDWRWLLLRAQSDLVSPRGSVTATTLPDGSQVRLAGNSAVRWLADGRGLELLRGSVVLNVTHDPDDPFQVRTGDLEVTVLGTQFGVFQRRGENRVGVLSGEVEVRAAGEQRRLSAGQQVRLVAGTLAADSVSPEEFFSWSSGRLLIRNRSLAEVIERLQPFSDRRIWLRTTRPQVRLNAVLALDDSDRALATVAQQAGLQLTTAGPVYILR